MSRPTGTATKGASGRGKRKDAQGVTSRDLHSQRRATRHTNRTNSRLSKGFEKGSRRFMNTVRPTKADLSDYVLKEFEKNNNNKIMNDQLWDKAEDIYDAERMQEKQVAAVLAESVKDSYGISPGPKTDNTVRVSFESYNSLMLFGPSHKRDKLKKLKATYDLDVMCGTEIGANLRMLPADAKFNDIMAASVRQTIAASNEHENFEKSLPGGVGMMVFGRLSNFVTAKDKDYLGLGRWCYVQVGTGVKKTWLIVAYNPVKPSQAELKRQRRKKSKVWEQHSRYFRKRNDTRDPRYIWLLQIVDQIKRWINAGDEVILMVDVNEDIYTGKLGRRLAADDIRMECLFKKITGDNAPFSHMSGSVDTKPVCAIYATPGIICTNVFQAAHGTGLGDHRLHIYDFDAPSVIGDDFPHLVRASGRTLDSRITHKRIKYNTKLCRLLKEHKMCTKLDHLDQVRHLISEGEFGIRYNKWDEELKDYMISSEGSCSKIKNDEIPWSPKFQVLQRIVYVRRDIVRFTKGEIPDTRNLWDRCKRLKIPLPRGTSFLQAQVDLQAAKNAIEDFREEAPKERQRHLEECMERHRRKKHYVAVRDIQRILQREQNKKTWGPCSLLNGKPRASPPLAVKIPDEFGEYVKYATKDDLNREVGRTLEKRYRMGCLAPICSSDLGSQLGHLAINDVADSVLDGTITFPSDTELYTKLLLQEAPRIFEQTSRNHLHAFLQTEDFQSWWLRSNEDIQSSPSLLHFGHYCCAAHEEYLSTIHTAKLNLALATGIGLDRWTKGLTVLLEKSFGQIYVEKLRAICLFEADFNWLSKVLFAKRMMTNARASGIIPGEHFAVKGTDPNDAIVCSVLAADIHRVNHTTFSSSSADFGDCYDSVAHPIASIALQAFGLNKNTVKLFLETLQVMDFFLRSGFGVSKEAWGGSTDDPNYGLGQGAGWAPSTFTATSTLNLNAYRTMGHGTEFKSAWTTERVFLLAAILYVDDGDLLEVALPGVTDDEFIEQVQQAVYDWGKLAQALGGYLKQKKCFSYFVGYKFRQGVAKLKKLREWRQTHLLIPQPGGRDMVPIPILDPTESKEKLGVLLNPAGKFTDQRAAVKKKGLDWAAALRSNSGRIPPNLGWRYFDAQLKPKLYWGLVAMSDDPTKLEEEIHRVFYQVLSPLRVNQHITREYRMMLPEHQGLGMFNINIDCLGKKISYLRRNWLCGTSVGELLFHAYQAFRVDLGLSGQVFQLNFDKFRKLSGDDGWYKHLWQLCWRYRVTLSVHQDNDPSPIRQGDQSLMDMFVSTGHFTIDQLKQLQRVRHFKKVYYLSDVVACDGKTITDLALSNQKGLSKKVYPTQCPTAKDFTIWVAALRAISGSTFTLDRPLGNFLVVPPCVDEWYASPDGGTLYNRILVKVRCFILVSSGATRTRSRPFAYESDVESVPDDVLLATVKRNPDTPDQVILHSVAPFPTQETKPSSFLDVLKSLYSPSLFEHLKYDGNPDEWVYEGLRRGTLRMIHDGSYMRNMAPDMCSAAVIICCTDSVEMMSCDIAERSEDADNYRGEILGAVLGLLLIHSILSCHAPQDETLSCHCDNMGVVKHANKKNEGLTENQVQADVIAVMKHVISIMPCPVQYHHVYGHQLTKQGKSYEQLDLTARMNELCDDRAKHHLIQSFLADDVFTGSFPYEQIVLHTGKDKVTSSPARSVHRWWSYKTARALFHSKKLIDVDDFNLIYWKGMGKVMKEYPRMFRIWVTKHVSHFCGTNRQLSRIDKSVSNVCPSCGRVNEDTHHITTCSDPGRKEMLMDSIGDLESWLRDAGTDVIIADLIVRYLKGMGRISMTDILHRYHDGNQAYLQLAIYHDKLGWDNFVEGRILVVYVDMMRYHYFVHPSRYKNAEWWAKGLMRRLLGITHRQWLHRNANVHIKKRDGKTQVQHEEIMDKVRDLIYTDPMDLLEEDRHLLQEDFAFLGRAPSSHREYWVSEMETALEFARRQRGPIKLTTRGIVQLQHNSDNHQELDLASAQPIGIPLMQFEPPDIDTEGSIKYSRRRRK